MDTPVYEYVMTKPDFLHAQKLYRKHRPRTAVLFWLWNGLLPALGIAAGIAWCFASATGKWRLAMQLAPFAAAGLWFALFIPIARWFQIRKLWKAAVPPSHAGKPVTFQFDRDQLISGIPGRSEGRFFWSAILDFAEDERLALLFVRDKFFLMVPKHAMPAESWSQLRRLAPKSLKKAF